MSDTIEYDLTGNYGLKKPWLDADDDVWGQHINENMDLIDNLFVTRGFDASKYLQLSGGIMEGMLTLAEDPVQPLDAATKGYVDGTVSAAVGAYLPLIGGNLTGPLSLPIGSVAAPSLAFGAADGTGISRTANALAFGVQGTLTFGIFAGSAQFYSPLYMLTNKITQLGDATAATDALNLRTADARYTASAGGPYLPLIGGEVTGQLQVDGSLRVGATVDAGFMLDVAGTGRFGGNLTVGLDTSTAASAAISINGAAGNQRQFLFRTASLTRWSLFTDNVAESGANAGSNLTLGAFNDAGAYVGPVFVANRATRVLTVNGTLANTTLGQDTGITAQFTLNAAAGLGKQILFRTASSSRWIMQSTATAETGGNAGSDFNLFRYDDTGTSLGSAFSIIRSTGAVTIPGALTLSNGGAFTGTFSGTHTYSGVITFSSSLNVTGALATIGGNAVPAATLQINAAAAGQRQIQFLTAGLSRWRINANATAEGGANAGTDLDITSYDDTGALLGNPAVRITRATGLLTAFFGLTVNSGPARFNGTIGFNNTAPIAKPTVTGAKAGNTALASLCAALVSYGLIADTSSA